MQENRLSWHSFGHFHFQYSLDNERQQRLNNFISFHSKRTTRMCMHFAFIVSFSVSLYLCANLILYLYIHTEKYACIYLLLIIFPMNIINIKYLRCLCVRMGSITSTYTFVATVFDRMPTLQNLHVYTFTCLYLICIQATCTYEYWIANVKRIICNWIAYHVLSAECF